MHRIFRVAATLSAARSPLSLPRRQAPNAVNSSRQHVHADLKRNSTYETIFIYFFYLFTVRDISLETDNVYPSTRLLLNFLLQNNKMYIA